MHIIKYTFDVPVVAVVSHIPSKRRIAVNHVTLVTTSTFFHFHLDRQYPVTTAITCALPCQVAYHYFHCLIKSYLCIYLVLRFIELVGGLKLSGRRLNPILCTE